MTRDSEFLETAIGVDLDRMAGIIWRAGRPDAEFRTDLLTMWGAIDPSYRAELHAAYIALAEVKS